MYETGAKSINVYSKNYEFTKPQYYLVPKRKSELL